MAKGLIGVGRVQKDQAMRALGESARLEAEQQLAQDALDTQRELAQKQTQGTLAGAGAAVGYLAGAGAAATGGGIGMATGAAAGPVGAVIGLVAGFKDFTADICLSEIGFY